MTSHTRDHQSQAAEDFQYLEFIGFEFAARFQIPIGTLRDWEQGRKDPDAAARAYLHVIGRNPGAVSEALRPAP